MTRVVANWLGRDGGDVWDWREGIVDLDPEHPLKFGHGGSDTDLLVFPERGDYETPIYHVAETNIRTIPSRLHAPKDEDLVITVRLAE